LSTEEKSAFNPEILLTFGDAIVSKKIKVMLRHSGIQEHWHVAENLPHADTYQKLSASILAKPAVFLAYLAEKTIKTTSNFALSWQKIDALRKERHAKYLQTTPFSDLKVFEILLKQLPENSVLQLANSSVIRYAQLFDDGRHVPHYSNRGAAGIDGSTSTAVGFALCTSKPVFLISGDISFFYDSNAFFHQHMPKNLKIIVVNNAGGNIFTIIPGPKTTGKSSVFFEAPQKASIELLSQTYGLNYLFAGDEQQLNLQFEKLKNAHKATVLEVKTPGEINSDILNNYFKFLQNGTTQLDKN
jgi:2-succinyl-5-enolpyruvyl-6-hydroxy-3-cyclohexene-1-carboxylate synthase